MKTLAIFMLSIFSQLCFGQNRSCKKNPLLSEIISCKKTTFKNKAQIYWQFNCDSSWLIFKNKNKKVVLDSQGLVELTGSLGYSSWTEYNNTFIIENRLASGCCEPPEIIVFNKNTGKKKINLGQSIYHSKIMKFPYVVMLDSINSNLIFFNVDNEKSFKINIPKGRIEKTMEIGNVIWAEELFNDGIIEDGIFKIEYRYEEVEEQWKTEKIEVDLKKYGS